MGRVNPWIFGSSCPSPVTSSLTNASLCLAATRASVLTPQQALNVWVKRLLQSGQQGEQPLAHHGCRGGGNVSEDAPAWQDHFNGLTPTHVVLGDAYDHNHVGAEGAQQGGEWGMAGGVGLVDGGGVVLVVLIAVRVLGLEGGAHRVPEGGAVAEHTPLYNGKLFVT